MYLFSCSNIVLLSTKKLCQARILPTITNKHQFNKSKGTPLFSIFWRGRVPLLCWSKYSYIKAMKRWPVRLNISINVWVNIMSTPMLMQICLRITQCSCDPDRMVVGFTTTDVISAYHHWCCEFESRSGQGVYHYVKQFVSNSRQVGGFLRFHPPIKLTATI